MFTISYSIILVLMTDLVQFEGRAELLKREIKKDLSAHISHSGPNNHKIKDSGKFGLYYDSLGKLTGCVGHLIVDIVDQKLCTNPDMALVNGILESDINSHNKYTLNVLKKHNIKVEKLPENVLIALLHLGFNIGPVALNGFKNTLRYIKIGDYPQAAENLLKSKWATQVGVRRSNFIYNLVRNNYGT